MKMSFVNRRQAMKAVVKGLAGLVVLGFVKPFTRSARAGVSNGVPVTGREPGVDSRVPSDYDGTKHSWRMVVDIDKCIGCGLCAKACKRENPVPPEPFFFRTWVERYIVKKAEGRGLELRGETVVDSPNGGIDGFPKSSISKDDLLKAFFVPKLCNQCANAPCTQSCPVGATFCAPDGVVLVDPKYCVGCGFCIQACPYGSRYMHPVTKTADKCSFCYHRITRGLRPACVEVCPNGARIFGDLFDESPDNPVRRFVRENKVQVLKPHLGTEPRVLYAGMDKEVR